MSEPARTCVELRTRQTGRLGRMVARLWASAEAGWRYPHWLAWEEALRDPGLAVDAAALAERLAGAGQVACGPFNSLPFEVWRRTGDRRWLVSFVAAARHPPGPGQTSPEGAWLHPRGAQRGGGWAVLLDSFQEEASRLAKLAALLRRGEVEESGVAPADLEERCAEQFAIHRALLRCPETGLWSNGRGWRPDPDARSPGAWSRGHGWLLRGLVECLGWLEEPAPRAAVREILRETATALVRFQRPDGLWSAIVDAEDSRALPETSGSAMIAGSLLRAVRRGDLPEAGFAEPARSSAERILADCLTDDGVVRGACRGPGPLESVAGYVPPASFPDDEPHGVAALCLLAAALAEGGRRQAVDRAWGPAHFPS